MNTNIAILSSNLTSLKSLGTGNYFKGGNLFSDSSSQYLNGKIPASARTLILDVFKDRLEMQERTIDALITVLKTNKFFYEVKNGQNPSMLIDTLCSCLLTCEKSATNGQDGTQRISGVLSAIESVAHARSWKPAEEGYIVGAEYLDGFAMQTVILSFSKLIDAQRYDRLDSLSKIISGSKRLEEITDMCYELAPLNLRT